MVFVAFYHILETLDKGAGITRIAADVIVEGVGLDICLVNDIQTVAVTQIKPVGVIWIMRGADGVDIKLLHQTDIGFHQFATDGLAGCVIVIVTVNAFDKDSLTIDKQFAVFDQYFAKANTAAYAFFMLIGF